MATPFRDAAAHLQRMLADAGAQEILGRLEPDVATPFRKIPGASLVTREAIERRWALLEHVPKANREELAGGKDSLQPESYAENIENFIGTVKLPIGLAGPLRINGTFAKGDYFVPLATTEAALVASYSRGALAITESGGCSAVLTAEGVSRAPGFTFESVREAAAFVAWALGERYAFARVAEATTRHGKFQDLRVTVEGNHVYLILEFTTGDAAGQNMVTFAAQAVCDYIAAHSPVKPQRMFVEANLSGDKKASAQSFQSVRGKKVTVETVVPAAVLAKRLHTDAAAMAAYWEMSALGGVLSGTIGVQGHYANGLAALFIATGQDAACVSEAAVGVTRFDVCNDGDLYAAVTLPNLIVGTVGGGTRLPSQAAALDILGLRGSGHARALAEVAAGLALAGELSIIAALAAGHFSRAHQKLARGESSK